MLAIADLASGFREERRLHRLHDARFDACGRRARRDAKASPRWSGTTGLTADAERALDELSQVAPVVASANFSVGVNLVLGLVEAAARALGPEWDAEVVETHHPGKRDAPSGTALALARAIAAGARGLRTTTP